jgi:hypothetical protein
MEESSIQQGVLMKMGSVDLIVCQEKQQEHPILPGGQGWADETICGSHKLRSELESARGADSLRWAQRWNLDQQVQLTEEEDQDDILMIGGIGIFLPCAQEEAEIVLQMVQQQNSLSADDDCQRRRIGADFGSCPSRKKKKREWAFWGMAQHFSQGAEKKEAVALKLAAKEAKEQAGKVITPWEMELEMLEDWLNNPGPARELTEFELSEKGWLNNKSVKGRLQSWSLQQSGNLRPQMKMKMKREAWEIMVICPIAKNFCSWGDCNNRTSHWSSWMKW